MPDLVNLDAVLLGGMLALAGAAIPAIFVFVDHWRERLQKSREVLRVKYEEMTAALDETVSWFYILDGCITHEDIVASHPSKAGRRIASLAMIYFPKIREEAMAYSNGLVDYYQWMADDIELTGKSIGEMAAFHPELSERINRIDALRHNLEEAIQKNANRYTNT